VCVCVYVLYRVSVHIHTHTHTHNTTQHTYTHTPTHARARLFNFAVEKTHLYWSWYCWGSCLGLSYLRDLGLSPRWFLWYLWWTELLWRMSFSDQLFFLLIIPTIICICHWNWSSSPVLRLSVLTQFCNRTKDFFYTEFTNLIFCVVSGFHRRVDENCPLVGYYAASNPYRRFETNYRSHLQGSRIPGICVTAQTITVLSLMFSSRTDWNHLQCRAVAEEVGQWNRAYFLLV